jgi:hypothetical protein
MGVAGHGVDAVYMLSRTLVLIAATAGLACASAAPAGAACSSGGPDKPDLGFVDSNCDGIDGDKAVALFVAPGGDDNHSGSFGSPKKTVQAAVTAGLAAGKDVYVAGGTYPEKIAFLGANGKIGVYGGYDPQTWQRSAANITTLEAPGQVVGFGAQGIVLQLLTIHSTATNTSLGSYGVRGFNSGSIALSRVTIKTVKGADGAEGEPSAPAPARAPDGSTATYNNCATWAGPGGTGEGYIWGGWGGEWSDYQFSMKGHDGKSDPNDPSISGGLGGTSPGQNGGAGTNGHQGIPGPGGSDILNRVSSFFQAEPGGPGTAGTRGAGGGGGAAGADICLPGSGGGAGGLPGVGGKGGQGGGGSIGVFAGTGARVVVLDGSTIQTSNGGHGGFGAPGQPSGLGGLGGKTVSRFDGATTHTNGHGGNGGSGGQGGRGGGGAGGASIGVLAIDGLAVVADDTAITVGAGGAGGYGANDGKPGVAQKTAQVTTPGGGLPAPGDFDGDGIADDADGCPIAAGSVNGCPAPEDAPSGPVAGDPTATAAGSPTSGSGSVAVSVLPAAGCLDKRVFTVRINPRKAHIKTARLVLDGHRLKIVKRSARRWTAKVDLRRSTRTSHTLTIRGKLRSGKRYKQVRRYTTCGLSS